MSTPLQMDSQAIPQDFTPRDEENQSAPTTNDTPCGNTQSKTSNYFQYTPMGGVAGGIGFVNAPLTASKVRNFKKELGNLVEDPVGISNQAD